MDDISLPAFWWVNQGTSYEEASAKGFLWAPKKNKAGNRVYHWENVSRVREGDFIFHYARGELRAISKAKSSGHEAQKELEGGQWSDDGWRVDADYCTLTKPVPLVDIGFDLAALHLDKGPVDKTGGARQGYLFEIPAYAARLLIARMGNDPALLACGIGQVITAERQASDGSGLSEVCERLLGGLEVSAVRAEDRLVRRLVSALLSKPFLILTGLAGSGKTKLAQAIARWLTPDPGWMDAGGHAKGKHPNSYCALVPVGADWTSGENIVGYPHGLQDATYVTTRALELIRHAMEPENADVPHFLILDEMNLSHVERYFADLLSAIESGEEIPLYEGGERTVGGKVVPRRLHLPNNLFVIGTVNVDETTYMFSPKVLDRANVIEFRMEPDEMAEFLKSPKAPSMESLDGKGAAFGKAFVEVAADKGLGVPDCVKSEYQNEMMLFFVLLKGHDAEFGYRTGYEAARFVHFYKLLGGYPDGSGDWFNGAMDAIIVQKFLPKLHGSRSRLEGLLWALAWACGAERIARDGKDFPEQLDEAGKAEDEGRYAPQVVWDTLKAVNPDDPAKEARYPLSFDKVMRMWRKLVRDQFVSFAEA